MDFFFFDKFKKVVTDYKFWEVCAVHNYKLR